MNWKAQIAERGLPERLTISLWDFSWYTRTGPGEPFENLDRAFEEATDRSINTVRICAAPVLLFGDHDLDTSALTFTNFGGSYGQGIRWYDVAGPATLDLRAQLVELFRAAKRHDCHVILTSWEYQQSSSFLDDDRWYRMLMAVEPEQRALVTATALADMIDFLAEHDLDDRIAFVEVHNEVTYSFLLDDLDGHASSEDTMRRLEQPLTKAVDILRERHPGIFATVSYARPPIGAMRFVPKNIQVGQFHVYVYGVVEELIERLGMRMLGDQALDVEAAKRLVLRAGSPAPSDYGPTDDNLWRLDATWISAGYFYVHDWIDAEKFDRWMYRSYGGYRREMDARLQIMMSVIADYTIEHDIPAVVGEGWLGYTPKDSEFEDGPIGRELDENAMDLARQLGFWGVVVSSNASPIHSFWKRRDVIDQLNRRFLDA